MWVASDNLRKGAALNAVQIAERALEMEVLRARDARQEARDERGALHHA